MFEYDVAVGVIFSMTAVSIVALTLCICAIGLYALLTHSNRRKSLAIFARILAIACSLFVGLYIGAAPGIRIDAIERIQARGETDVLSFDTWLYEAKIQRKNMFGKLWYPADVDTAKLHVWSMNPHTGYTWCSITGEPIYVDVEIVE